MQPGGAFDAELSPQASEQTAFLRTDFFNENPDEPCLPPPISDCFKPLVTGKEGYANVPPATRFGEGYFSGKLGPCPLVEVFCGPTLRVRVPMGSTSRSRRCSS